ncbi:hypothetical protein RFI_06651 [Reticulomyxa filosa]|uniref:MAT1 centre domain-containing protein n=1 Tax=Reticulomyxa filosa TaxID=46433 RepID=X6NWW6_RETFI|nr:hypothetical protein RFI_06651 [Reticulomyxa filosa]|eukprot:ETO30466.1 hypothetical protein RFI_06651 [Reticulomyxa filosa]
MLTQNYLKGYLGRSIVSITFSELLFHRQLNFLRLQNTQTLRNSVNQTIELCLNGSTEYACGNRLLHSVEKLESFFDAEECPHCNTSKLIKPDLVFLFSECCGYVLCEQCLNGAFKSNPFMHCGNCNNKISKKSFKSESLSLQKFKTQSDARRRVNGMLNLRSTDFASQKEWDDFLERVEDLVYGLTYGNSNERSNAENELKKLQHKYETLIAKNQALDVEREQKQKIMEMNELSSFDENTNVNLRVNDMNVNMSRVVNTLHPVYDNPINPYRGPMCQDNEDKPLISDYLNDNPKELENKRQMAGGFNQKMWKMKDKKEAFAGMIFFHS